MAYALQIGLRYLRSKKRATVSVITFIAVAGVALGVGALLGVISITSGFQDEFRNKVLGVNAHVLVQEYGLDFSEYRDVIQRAERMSEVAGAAPFVINEMILAKGDRISGVLVKGVDPELVLAVLDMPTYLVNGSLRGLRVPGRGPPIRPHDLDRPVLGDDGLDSFLDHLARADAGVEARAGALPVADASAPARRVPAWGGTAGQQALVPSVRVPTPQEMEQSLGGAAIELPSDEHEEQVFAQEEAEIERDSSGRQQVPGIVVGVTLAKTLGLGVGDRVKLISPLAGLDTSFLRPSETAPRSTDFKVIGIFSAGFQEYDSRLAYIDLYEAQAFVGKGDTVTGVEMRLHDITRARDVSRRLERSLGGGPFHTVDWQELNLNLFTALEIQKIMLSLVIASIIFVAALNVIATLIMVVIEKKREIAILKAMGAKDRSILAVFLVQGTVVGVVGTIVGLVLGGAVCTYLSVYEFPLDPKVYLIDHLPVRIGAAEVLFTAATAVLICMAATLIPSWWAARLLPADGVRYE